MALIRCADCGGDVSTTAKTCPKCGWKVKIPGPFESLPTRVKFIITSAAIGVVIYASAQYSKDLDSPEYQARKAAAEAESKKESRRIGAMLKAQEQLRKAAREPESVKFRDIYATEDGSVVCGKYNAKNGFGGYEGYRSFVYARGKLSNNQNDLKALCWDTQAKLILVEK